MAYYLEKANRNYVVLERGSSAGKHVQLFLWHIKMERLNCNNGIVLIRNKYISGTFYKQYPRHRKLISINKRFTGIVCR